jgi:hypothetical protein
VDDTIEVLAASKLTAERLERLQAILEQAREGELSADAATDAVAEEAPELRPLLERYGPTMRTALVWLLLALVQVLIAQGLAELRDDSATREDVRKAMDQAVEQCKQEEQPPPSSGHRQSPP